MYEKVTYKFFFTFPIVSSISCLFNLDGFWDRMYVVIQLLFLYNAASRICLKQHIAFLCSSASSFFFIFLVSRWCIETVVLTQLQLERSYVLFYQEDQISIMTDNMSIAIYAIPMCMLTLLSVNEILLPRYVN